ncbi:hypothetical protein WN51_04847 [Melipona quadrifasciata]|uniref:Uncharacterized protein n=1 Tax=Melipona quadrifasciata TaxID=166423 RepID=A0A0M8ZSK3_9HYME|nr:hypothetical protein WN51_04847 [Melipona quadrifasciata]
MVTFGEIERGLISSKFINKKTKKFSQLRLLYSKCIWNGLKRIDWPTIDRPFVSAVFSEHEPRNQPFCTNVLCNKSVVKIIKRHKLKPAIHLDNRYRLMRNEPMLDADGNETDQIGEDETAPPSPDEMEAIMKEKVRCNIQKTTERVTNKRTSEEMEPSEEEKKGKTTNHERRLSFRAEQLSPNVSQDERNTRPPFSKVERKRKKRKELKREKCAAFFEGGKKEEEEKRNETRKKGTMYAGCGDVEDGGLLGQGPDVGFVNVFDRFKVLLMSLVGLKMIIVISLIKLDNRCQEYGIYFNRLDDWMIVCTIEITMDRQTRLEHDFEKQQSRPLVTLAQSRKYELFEHMFSQRCSFHLKTRGKYTKHVVAFFSEANYSLLHDQTNCLAFRCCRADATMQCDLLIKEIDQLPDDTGIKKIQKKANCFSMLDINAQGVLEKQGEKRNSEKTDRTLRDAKQMRKQQVKRRKEEISGQGAPEPKFGIFVMAMKDKIR